QGPAARPDRHRAWHPGDPHATVAGRGRPPLDRPARVGQRGRRARLQHHRRPPGPAAVQAGGRRGQHRDRARPGLPDRPAMTRRPAVRVAAVATAAVAGVYVVAVIVLNVLAGQHLTGQVDGHLESRLADARTSGLAGDTDTDTDGVPVFL